MTGANKLRFVFITPFIEEDFFKPVKKGLGDAADLFGVEVKFTGTKGASANEIVELIRIIEQSTKDGYNGIVLSICHPSKFNDAVNQTVEKGIPVIAFNIDTPDVSNKRLSAVCQNLYEAGKTLGRNALAHINEGTKILMTMHDEGIAALEERLAGEQAILKEKNVTWKCIVTGNTPDLAAETIKEALTHDGQISAILCTGQSDTEGAGIVVSSDPVYRNIYVAGFDLSPGILKFIEDGVIDFTIDQQPYIQGFYPVAQLFFYCSYGIKPSNIDAGAAIVNRANVKSIIQANKFGFR